MKKNIMIALLFAIGLGQMAPVMAMKGQNSFSSSFKQIPNKQISKTNRDIIRNYKVNDYDGIYIRKFMVAMCNNEQASVCFNDFFDEIFDSSKNYYFDEMHFVESFFKEQFCDHCSHFLKQNIVTQLSEEDLQIYLDCHNVEDFKNMIINDLQNFFRKKQADYVYCSLRDGLLYNSVGDYIQSKLSSDSEHSKKRIFDSVKLSHEKFIMDCLEQKKSALSCHADDLSYTEQFQKDYNVLTYYLSDNGSLASKSSPSNNIGFASLGFAAASLTKDVMASYNKEIKKLLIEKQQQVEQDKKLKGKRGVALTRSEKVRCALAMLKKHANPKNIKANKMFWAAAAVALGSLMYNKKESFKMPSFSMASFGGNDSDSDYSYDEDVSSDEDDLN